jgi:hypothetical protein
LTLLNILAPALVNSFSFGGLKNISSNPQSSVRVKRVEDSFFTKPYRIFLVFGKEEPSGLCAPLHHPGEEEGEGMFYS